MAIRSFVYFDAATGQYKEQTSSDTIQIADGVNALDAVNVGQLESKASIAASAVATEKARAEAAEAMLQGNIDTVSDDLAAEILRATGEEQAIAADLAQEILDRQTAVSAEASARAQAVSAEQTRAQTAESAIATDLAQEISDRGVAVLAEKTRAETAEASLRTDLNAEIVDRATAVLAEKTRAELEEAALLTAINQEITDRGLAVSAEALARSNAVSAEQTRAEGVEASLRTDLNQEIQDRQSAITSLEQTLTGLIDDEETRALAAEGVLQDHIDDEAARAIAAEGVLTTNLASEVSRAMGVEGSLRTDLNAEIVDRQTAISDEALARQNADDFLSADIASERTDRIGADTALGIRIDGEATARINAILAEESARIQGDADTLAAAKAHSDGIAAGFSFKGSVRVALPYEFTFPANRGGAFVSLPADFMSIKAMAGLDAGDKILLINKDDGSTSVVEGIYIVNPAGTALVRDDKMPAGSDASGVVVYVEEGVLGSDLPFAAAGTMFACAALKGDDVVGTDALDFGVYNKAEVLAFINGLQKSGLEVSVKPKTNGAIGATADGVEVLFDSVLLTIDGNGHLTLADPLAGGPMHIADDLHGHGRMSELRASTAANETHFAKYDGSSASWNSASCMAFVESKDVSDNAVIVYGGKGKNAALVAALSTFSVGETIYLGQTGGEFSDFAGVPSGKFAVPVGKKAGSDSINVAIGVALLKA